MRRLVKKDQSIQIFVLESSSQGAWASIGTLPYLYSVPLVSNQRNTPLAPALARSKNFPQNPSRARPALIFPHHQ